MEQPVHICFKSIIGTLNDGYINVTDKSFQSFHRFADGYVDGIYFLHHGKQYYYTDIMDALYKTAGCTRIIIIESIIRRLHDISLM